MQLTEQPTVKVRLIHSGKNYRKRFSAEALADLQEQIKAAGGVLEPIQAGPVIIEDNCFIGARSEVVEGVVVGENSVISMGVYIGQSTPIYDR